jgi:hypothetical protein
MDGRGATPAVLVVGAGAEPLARWVLAAASLAGVHLFGHRLARHDTLPSRRVLSAAGGVSVSYVFLHLLPEIRSAGRTLEDEALLAVAVESHVFVVALAGFVTFYGLEWVVRRSTDATAGEGPPRRTFWLHVGCFAVYNVLIGYLVVHREEPGPVNLLLFVVAMGLHMLVNDVGLRYHHSALYHDVGRWVLAGGVAVGFGVGLATPDADVVVAVLFAFVGGGVILNVIKEEVPEERRSRFPAFAAGVVAYGVLLVAL